MLKLKIHDTEGLQQQKKIVFEKNSKFYQKFMVVIAKIIIKS